MKAEFLIENIEGFLPTLSKTLPVHSQIPILSNLMIEADKTGLYVYATNLETGVRIKVPSKIEETGVTTVPGKQFLDALSAFPKDKVTISLEKDKLTLLCRGSRVVFQTIPKEEFPTLYEEKGEKIYEFGREELKKIFSKLIFATSIDESRPELTGILVSQREGFIDFVATDGFRLSLEKIKGGKILTEKSHLILPSRAVSEALSLKDEKIALYLYSKANQVIFETADTLLVGRIIRGEFPDYEKAVPSSSKTEVVVDREDFLQNLRISSVFARESANIVKIKTESGKIRIFSGTSGLGEGEAVVEAQQKGEDNEIAFNIKFLTDLLRSLSGKTVSISLSSGVEPAMFKTDEDPSFTHIIMPVRVQD